MNFVAPEKAPTAAEPDEDFDTWKFPWVHRRCSAPADALVTIIEFSDYQCPFCKKVRATLDQLVSNTETPFASRSSHNPRCPFTRASGGHKLHLRRTRRRATTRFLASEPRSLRRARGGPDGRRSPRDCNILHLDRARVKAAIQKEVHRNVLTKTSSLPAISRARHAALFHQRTPSHRCATLGRIRGTRGRAARRRERARRKGHSAEQGLRGDSDHAEGPPPVVVDLGVVPKERAFRGPASATVVVHGSHFQRPFCSRVSPALAELRREFPRDVKIVWHNLPLPFHSHARQLRTRRSKCEPAAMRPSGRRTTSAVRKSALVRRKARGAWQSRWRRRRRHPRRHPRRPLRHRHQRRPGPRRTRGNRGTPGFVINGYLVSGAQPLAEFRRTVRRALADHQSAGKIAPGAVTTVTHTCA